MEGAYYTVIKLISVEGVISLVATIRYLLWMRAYVRRGLIDLGLLIAQIIMYVICMPILISDIVRNWGFIVQILQIVMVLLPLTAACLAQIAIFIGMSAKFSREELK